MLIQIPRSEDVRLASDGCRSQSLGDLRQCIRLGQESSVGRVAVIISGDLCNHAHSAIATYHFTYATSDTNMIATVLIKPALFGALSGAAKAAIVGGFLADDALTQSLNGYRRASKQ